MKPTVRYATVEGANVAYQVVGDGPVDIVFHLGWNSHIDFQWEVPPVARFISRLSSFARVICFDRRGHGLSDPVDLDNMTLEAWMDDVEAVMDAAGSDRAVLFGTGEGGPLAILTAATHPDRTSGLVLVDTHACMGWRPDHPWGITTENLDQAVEFVADVLHGRQDSLDAKAVFFAAPSFLREPAGAQLADLHLRWFRSATSPGLVERLQRIAIATDVRHALALVQCPAVVMHRSGDFWANPGQGRYIAEHIPEARFVELEGDDHFPWLGDQDSVLDEIEAFVTGHRPVHVEQSDRMLGTVLFTDIVASTERLARMGDKRWLEVLNAHNDVIRDVLEQFRGREVGTRGDGFVAIFDGPARGVRCARTILERVRSLGLDLRVGLHSGEVDFTGSDVSGMAVHTGARVAQLASPGEVLVSQTVVDLVAGSDLLFDDRGVHELKGVPGEWQLFSLAS